MKHLTGRTRFRPQGKKLVLQVEEGEFVMVPPGVGSTQRTWRDAKVEDLCEIQHLTYGHITVHAKVHLPDAPESLPGEDKVNARKLH